MAPELVASDIYPAVRRFLTESGLARTLKAFDKETTVDGELEASVSKKKAKAIRKIELLAACQLALETNVAGAATPQVEEDEAPKKKRKREEDVEKHPCVMSPQLKAAMSPKFAPASSPKLKASKSPKMKPAPEPVAEVEEEAEEPKKKKNKQEKGKSGVPFSRVDDAKWRATLTDEKFIDNSHLAKQKFGGSAGDSWADSAAVDMLKVKGKGFRKEMQKKKRASWKGSGELDQGVNSVRFADASSEDEY